MKNLSKKAFITTMALLCYAGFATAQVVSLDSLGDVSTLVNDLKFGGPGGFGGHGGGQVPPPSGPSHGGGFGDHNGPGDHGGFPGDHGGDHNGPGNHGGFPGDHGGFPGDHGGDYNGPGPNPWHPQPGPQPGPWHPQPDPWHPQPQPWHPQPGPQPQPWNPQPWHPHHDGHPDWNHNDWNNDQWNHHGQDHNDWWNNYDNWWNNSSSHPYSMYRTVCTVNPGVSAQGYIVEATSPFNGKATFYYYSGTDMIIGASAQSNGVFVGGNGTSIMDITQVPQADHCFLAITQ